jgi:hypothetical protein
MENELEKSYSSKELIIGERYSLIPGNISEYFFILLSKNNNQLKVLWNNGDLGLFPFTEYVIFFNNPLTPVERLLW